MAKIKIDDLPTFESLTPDEVKGIFGGTDPTTIPSTTDPASITAQDPTMVNGSTQTTSGGSIGLPGSGTTGLPGSGTTGLPGSGTTGLVSP